tara:strand:+ start:176 stop:1096 length:921 start_codon:yes stop_codon:yes gene_type:complete
MNGVQGNQAAQVRMFAHDAIPVALGAINPEFGITIDSGGYGYAVGNTIVLNTGTGTGPVAAQLKVTSIGSSSIINVQANASKFYLDGQEKPAITLNRGKTYTFYQKATSNDTHILAFSSTDPDAFGGATPYTDGVVAAGTAGIDRVVTFTVPSNAPNSLWYYCTAHSNMGAAITIQDSGTDYANTTTAVKSFEVIRLTTDKPFGKGYAIADKVQPGTETYSTSAPSAFIGSIASIDLASTNERGACIYIGVKMQSMTAKMESGKLATFKDVAAGSFMPILVKQIATAQPDGGTLDVLDDNDIVALY